jgi:hypothetical protein
MILPTGLAVMIKYLAANIAGVVAALFLTCGAALAQSAPDATATQNTAKLTTVLMAIPAGTPRLSIRLGLACLLDNDVRRATGGRDPQDLPPYTAAFKTELERAAFKAVADDDLFNREETGAADYQVAAVITDAHVVACASRAGLLSGNKLGDARGTGSMKVDWQVYSPLRKEVVARLSTSGSVDVEKTVPDGMTQLIVGDFASNVRELTANAEFRTAMRAKPLTTNDVLLVGGSKARSRCWAARRPYSVRLPMRWEAS